MGHKCRRYLCICSQLVFIDRGFHEIGSLVCELCSMFRWQSDRMYVTFAASAAVWGFYSFLCERMI